MFQLLHLPVLLYLVRTLLISGAFFAYYQLFLRNAPFHTYNRWYLLLTAPSALILPLLHLPFRLSWTGDPASANLVELVFWGGSVPSDGITAGAGSGLQKTAGLFSPAELLITCIYGIVVIILLTGIVRSLWRIIKMARNYPSARMGKIRLYETTGRGAPFSFFNRLFWNPQWDTMQGPGHLIFLHESYHIRHRHTLDLLALEILQAFGWFNPFLHWTLGELRTLHEFAADSYALGVVQSGETKTSDLKYDYAELLVWQSVSAPDSFLTHSFFHHQLNRRISMITSNPKKQMGLLKKITVLPLLLLLLGAFATAPRHHYSPPGTHSDSTNQKVLARFYIRYMRYPNQAMTASREGAVWFSVRTGENGALQEYKPMDAAPERKDLIKISVQALGSQASKASSADNDIFQQECRRVAGLISTDKKASTLKPGLYYLQVTFQLRNQ